MKQFFTLLILTIVISSCSDKAVFKQYKTFENTSWNRFDILLFEVPVESGDYLNFELTLRHHTYFPYDYLDANITFYSPSGEMRSAEYHFKLKDKNGKWKADGMGELWDIELPIRDSLYFNKSGTCKVRVENKLTKIETPGIVELGLIVKTSKE